MSWKRFFRPRNQRPSALLFNACGSLVFLVVFACLTVREGRKLMVQEEALQPHRGQVVDIFVDTKLKRGLKIPGKRKRYTLTIDHSVDNGLERYRFGHNHRSRFGALQQQIRIRDTVVLYTSTANFDGKNPRTIWRVDKEGQPIFFYAEAQRQTRLVVIVCVLATAVMLLLFWWNMRLFRRAK